jgi:hypothetical protein
VLKTRLTGPNHNACIGGIMAESTSTTSRTQKSIQRAKSLAENRWPRGLVGLLDDYRNGHTTLSRIKFVVGLHYRAAQRLLESHGVKLRDAEIANAIFNYCLCAEHLLLES